MSDRPVRGQQIQRGLEGFRLKFPSLGQELDEKPAGALHVVHNSVDFYAVAGRENHPLKDLLAPAELIQELRQFRLRDVEFLPQFNRRGLMAYTQGNNIHGYGALRRFPPSRRPLISSTNWLTSLNCR